MKIKTENYRADCGSKDCDICWREVPDPTPAKSTAEQIEVQRLTLENSLLRGELNTMRAHAALSKG